MLKADDDATDLAGSYLAGTLVDTWVLRRALDSEAGLEESMEVGAALVELLMALIYFMVALASTFDATFLDLALTVCILGSTT